MDYQRSIWSESQGESFWNSSRCFVYQVQSQVEFHFSARILYLGDWYLKPDSCWSTVVGHKREVHELTFNQKCSCLWIAVTALSHPARFYWWWHLCSQCWIQAWFAKVLEGRRLGWVIQILMKKLNVLITGKGLIHEFASGNELPEYSLMILPLKSLRETMDESAGSISKWRLPTSKLPQECDLYPLKSTLPLKYKSRRASTTCHARAWPSKASVAYLIAHSLCSSQESTMSTKLELLWTSWKSEFFSVVCVMQERLHVFAPCVFTILQEKQWVIEEMLSFQVAASSIEASTWKSHHFPCLCSFPRIRSNTMYPSVPYLLRHDWKYIGVRRCSGAKQIRHSRTQRFWHWGIVC